ncbi:histidine phosphatase family protein [Bacteroidota bacterium]
MKTLVIVRHSKAELHKYGLSDFNRKLAKRGLREAPFIAEKIKDLGYFPDALISSPAARALKSCQFYAGVFGIPKQEILQKDFMYDFFEVEDIRELLTEELVDKERVFVFGHNPTFAELIHDLTPGFHDLLPTSGAVGIEFNIDNWADMKRKSGIQVFFEYPKKYISS